MGLGKWACAVLWCITDVEGNRFKPLGLEVELSFLTSLQHHQKTAQTDTILAKCSTLRPKNPRQKWRDPEEGL